MASIDDLKNVLKETLDNRGALNQIRARIRAEVFSALDDQTEPKPVLSNENMFINELIRDYLEFNQYKYTSTVLMAESGQPKDPIDREFLAAELNINESRKSKQLPILYGLVAHFLDGKNKEPTQSRRSPTGRLSPVSGRRSPPVNGRISPSNGGRLSPATGRRSPISGQRSPPPASIRMSPGGYGARKMQYSPPVPDDDPSNMKGLVYHAKSKRN